MFFDKSFVFFDKCVISLRKGRGAVIIQTSKTYVVKAMDKKLLGGEAKKDVDDM